MQNENVLLLKHINTFRYFGESCVCKKCRNSNFTFLFFTVAPTIDTDDQDLMEAVEPLESQHEQRQRSDIYQEAESAPESSVGRFPVL